MEGIRFVCHIKERRGALVTIQQHSHAFRVGVDQRRLAVVIPGRQLAVEPLHTPGLSVAS